MENKILSNDRAIQRGDLNSSLGPKELFVILLSNWLKLTLSMATGILVASAYLYVAVPMYKSSATVLFESKAGQMALAFGDADGLGFSAGHILSEFEIIRSRLVLERVVKDLKSDIVIEPRYFPVIGGAIARRDSVIGKFALKVPGLRRFVWNRPTVVVPTFDVPVGYENIAFTFHSIGESKFNILLGDKLLVSGGEVGKIISLELSEARGEKLTVFVSDFNASLGSNLLIKKLKATAAINKLKGILTVEENQKGSGVILITAISETPEYAAKVANSVASAYLRQNVERRSAEAAQTLAFLKSQLPTVRARVESAESALNSYRLRESSVDLDKETAAVLAQSTTVEQKKNELIQKKGELLLTLTAAHPSVVALDTQQRMLADQAAKVQQSIAKLPTTQQELLRLRREVEVNTGLYTNMLSSMQELEVAEAGTLGNVRLMDEAFSAGKPFQPDSLIVLIAGFVAGLAIGLAMLIITQLLDHAEHDPAVIESITGIPVYATIPFSRGQKKLFENRNIAAQNSEKQVLVVANPNDPAAEAVRSLRTTLHFSVFEAKNKSILFTGPTPGIGKSFVTSNLSAVLAQVPMNVILIDADLRRGTIHDYYGLERGKGVSDYVLGTSLSEVLRESGVPNLKIISTGNIPPNPTELLMTKRFSQLVEEAESLADLVLIDTGPILAVSDASIIGQIAGATLLVIKAGQHSRREILETVKRLQQVGVVVRGLVVNQVGRGGTYGYYGYGKYGYYNYKYASVK